MCTLGTARRRSSALPGQSWLRAVLAAGLAFPVPNPAPCEWGAGGASAPPGDNQRSPMPRASGARLTRSGRTEPRTSPPASITFPARIGAARAGAGGRSPLWGSPGGPSLWVDLPPVCCHLPPSCRCRGSRRAPGADRAALRQQAQSQVYGGVTYYNTVQQQVQPKPSPPRRTSQPVTIKPPPPEVPSPPFIPFPTPSARVCLVLSPEVCVVLQPPSPT